VLSLIAKSLTYNRKTQVRIKRRTVQERGGMRDGNQKKLLHQGLGGVTFNKEGRKKENYAQQGVGYVKSRISAKNLVF